MKQIILTTIKIKQQKALNLWFDERTVYIRLTFILFLVTLQDLPLP